MAIFVVYMTVWKTFFTLYCIMLSSRLQSLTHGALFLSGWTYDMKAGILNIHC